MALQELAEWYVHKYLDYRVAALLKMYASIFIARNRLAVGLGISIMNKNFMGRQDTTLFTGLQQHIFKGRYAIGMKTT